MSIEEVLKEATIKFQTPLTLEQTGELLDYIQDNLPARISSTTEIHEQRFCDHESKKQKKERGTVKILGMIANTENPCMFSSFTTIPYSRDTSQISAIRFSPIPGYTLEEHRPEEVLLWKELRQQVSNYFKQK